MTAFSIYKLPQVITITLAGDTNGASAMNYPVNRTDFNVYRNVRNEIEIFVRDSDRKYVNLSGLSLKFTMIDPVHQTVILTKNLTIIDASRGLTRLILLGNETVDLPLRFLRYTIELTRTDGTTVMLFTDRDYGIHGFFDVIEGPVPKPVEAIEILSDDFILTDGQYVSGAFAGAARTGNSLGFHTIAVYPQIFTDAGSIIPENWQEQFSVSLLQNSPKFVNGPNDELLTIGNNGVIFSADDSMYQNWTQVNSSGENLNSGLNDGSLYVVVGNVGNILTSPDGVVWSTQSSGTVNDLTAIAKNILWLAGGDNGIVLSSPDGITWTTIGNILDNSNITDMLYANAKFVVITDDGKIAYSLDEGNTWTLSNTPTVSSRLNKIIFANGYFVVSGNNQTLLASGDGITWFDVSASFWNNSDITSLSFNNGFYVAGSNTGILATSDDGETWTIISNNGITNLVPSSKTFSNVFIYGSGSPETFLYIMTDGTLSGAELIAETIVPPSSGDGLTTRLIIEGTLDEQPSTGPQSWFEITHKDYFEQKTIDSITFQGSLQWVRFKLTGNLEDLDKILFKN